MYKKVKTLLFSAALLLCCLTASAVGTQPSTGDGSQARQGEFHKNISRIIR